MPAGNVIASVLCQRIGLFPLPGALAALPDASRTIDPRFAVKVHRYDEATGTTKHEAITSYGWASSAAFTIQRVACW